MCGGVCVSSQLLVSVLFKITVPTNTLLVSLCHTLNPLIWCFEHGDFNKCRKIWRDGGNYCKLLHDKVK